MKFYIDAGTNRDPLEPHAAHEGGPEGRGYVQGKNLYYYEHKGGRHTEASWAERVHMPLRFLFPWQSASASAPLAPRAGGAKGGNGNVGTGSVTSTGRPTLLPVLREFVIACLTVGACTELIDGPSWPARWTRIAWPFGKYGSRPRVFSTGVEVSQSPCTNTTGIALSIGTLTSSPMSRVGQSGAEAMFDSKFQVPSSFDGRVGP